MSLLIFQRMLNNGCSMKVIKRNFVVLCIAAFLIMGCASSVEYVPVALTLPESPVLPTIKSTELQCLSDEAYTKLVQRDRLQRGHIQVLEAIIVSTQK